MPLGEVSKRFYSGMLPKETALWREWLFDHEEDFDRFEYNVHIGPGLSAPPEAVADLPELQATLERQFREATQFRIDALGHQGPAVTIFELKMRAGPGALGQLMTYRELWTQTHPPIAPLTLVLIARTLAPGMDEPFRRAGIVVFILD